MSTALVGTITPGPADTKVPVVKRTVTVVLNGNPLEPMDATGGPISFPCSVGDHGSATLVDTSAGGVNSEPLAITFVAHDNVTAPATPNAVVTFAPAPAPAA
jgi:hypothetical protein